MDKWNLEMTGKFLIITMVRFLGSFQKEVDR